MTFDYAYKSQFKGQKIMKNIYNFPFGALVALCASTDATARWPPIASPEYDAMMRDFSRKLFEAKPVKGKKKKKMRSAKAIHIKRKLI